MLTFSQFQKKYPGNPKPVLSINDKTLTDGIYWIKGENGSGKTSLMKSIAGLLPFDGGIKVNDLSLLANRMAYTKIVNYAEAEPQYPAFLTGKELIDFYVATKNGAFPFELHKALGVEKFMHNKTGIYSSGMLKKLSLVLAFIGNPALILLDEPLIALDVNAVQALQNCIVDYRKVGVSFILTSHQQIDEKIMRMMQMATY